MGFVEQRKTPRFEAAHDVTVVRDGDSTVGKTANLSLGGASLHVELAPVPSVGELFELSFRIPTHDEPLRVKAEVRWCANVDPGTLGVRFVTGFRAKETYALNKYLDSLADKTKEEP